MSVFIDTSVWFAATVARDRDNACAKSILQSTRDQVTTDHVLVETWLLLNMQLDIEMEGFVDLFYQFYSLKDCAVVEASLEKLGLHQLASQFAEAKNIYVEDRSDITEEEYRQVDWTKKNERWSRFDAIGEEILANGSELYLIGDRIEAYVKANL